VEGIWAGIKLIASFAIGALTIEKLTTPLNEKSVEWATTLQRAGREVFEAAPEI
jgi:hypothetical protein